MNGSDQFHYLYISGGTGAAEAVLITGGTAVSGAASGSMIVNCANTHTGAWTIQSASAGIQEAINILPSGAGTVIIPVGDHTVRGTVTVPGSNTAITGLHGASVTDNTAAGMNLFRFFRPGGLVGGRNAIRDLYITCLKTSDSCIYIDGQNTMLVRDIYIQGGSPTGITIAANAGTFDVYIENVNVSLANATAGKGIAILGSGSTKPSAVYISKTQLASGQYGLYLTGVGGLYVSQTDIIVPTTGIMIAPGTGSEVSLAWFSDVTVDTCGDNGIQTSPTGSGSVSSLQFIGCWTATCTGVGVQINAGGSTVVDGIRFIGHRSVNNQKHGVQLNGGINLQLSDCTIAGNSTGSIGVFHGLAVADGRVQVSGCRRHLWAGGQIYRRPGVQYFHCRRRQQQLSDYQRQRLAAIRWAASTTRARGSTRSSKTISANDDAGFQHDCQRRIDQPGNYGSIGVFHLRRHADHHDPGGWRGREITLIFTGAPPGAWERAAISTAAQTAVQYQAIRLTFDGTGWF